MTQEQKNVSIPGVTVNTSISTFPAPVGIGASDPQSVLHIVSQSPVVKVEDTATAPAAVPRINFMDSAGLLGEVGYSGAADSALYITNAKPDAVHILTNSVKRMTVLGTGNIGIGTVTPSVTLEVVGGLSAARVFTASLTATTFTVTGVSTLGSATATTMTVSNGLSAGTIFTPSLTATTLNATTMTVTSVTGSNLYVSGGLTAASTLAVVGTTTLAGVTASNLYVSGGVTAASTLAVVGTTTLAGVTASNLYVSGGVTAASTLKVVGVTTMAGVTADSLNVVGGVTAPRMFTTSLTASTLHVTGVSTLAGVTASNLYVSGGVTAAASLAVVGVSTLAGVTAESLFVKNGLTATASLGVVGNITIAGSLALLQSAAAMSTTSNMSFISNGAYPTFNRIVVGTDGTGYKFAISTMTASSSIIDRLTIVDNGFVGIGTTNPAYALDVTGTIRASTNLIVSGTANVSGVTTLVGVTADSMFVKGGVTAGTVSATTFNGALNGNANTATLASTVTTNANLSGDVTSTGSNTTAIAPGVIVNADINANAAITDTKLDTIATTGKVSNSATTATSAPATANAIVARDPSGGFVAAGITGTSINVSSYQLASTGFNNQTVTAYTILATDNGKIVTGSSTSAITFTLPAAAIGFSVTIIQSDTGSITIKPNGSDTLNSFGKTSTTGLTTGGQWAAVDVVCTAGTKWVLFGNLA